MSCFSGRKKEKRLRKRHNIHPEPVKKTRPSVYDKPVKDIGEMIGKERITCGVCSQTFSLNEDQGSGDPELDYVVHLELEHDLYMIFVISLIVMG